MINFLKAGIYGIVQGITEFWPISSSGHLVILHKILPLPLSNELVFDVLLHLATLLAIIYFFKQEISLIIIAWFQSFKGEKSQEGKIGWIIILATVPAALAGYFFESFIESSLRSILVVVIMLILVGFLFIIFEKFSKLKLDYKELNVKQGLIIGLAQALALIPGTSRSGITIIAGLALGLKREAAIKFSFLLAVPIIAGANIRKMPALFNFDIPSSELILILIAFLAAFLSGLLAIKFLLQLSKKYTLVPFAIYRFLLALLIIIYLL